MRAPSRRDAQGSRTRYARPSTAETGSANPSRLSFRGFPGQHAVAMLIAGLFEHHDRRHFEVIGLFRPVRMTAATSDRASLPLSIVLSTFVACQIEALRS